MLKPFIICCFLWIHLINACLPGTNYGLGYPGYGSYPPTYMASYNGYPASASYGVPFKSRHEASTDTKTALMANTDSNNGCVTKFDNSRLTCATAFERRPLSTESECQKLCFENILKCQSFEFNTLTATCDLYNVPPPEGVMESTKNNPKSPFSDEPLKDKNDFSYRVKRQFNPLDQQDPLKLPQFPNYCEPEVVPALGTSFYVPNLDCAPSNQFSSSSIDNNLEPLNNHQHRLPASVSSIIPTSGTKIIPEMTDCRDGGRARIQLIDGIAFVPEKSSVARIQVDSADVCLLLCRNNAYLDGTRFQKPCIAATFDRGTGRCTIMDEAITPNGQLQYTPHADSVYFEKICIPVNELPLNCDDVVHRIPQRVLDGQADATVDAPNQIDCIRRCITASRLLGFTCQSATYYFEFPVQNCILNRFTRTSRPNSFAAELRQKVDYMEMAPCMIIDWQQRDVAWSEWSECDQTSTKTRKRNCTNCDKKQETVACSHPKSSQSDFPIITKNIESDLIPVRKQIVTNFDSAKNLRKQEIKNLPDDEKSLFGENDYENQHEVSYFGPPRNEQKMDNVLDSKKIEDITVDAVKELEKAAMREARNHRVETTMDNEPTKTGNHLRSTKTEETYENELNLGEGIGIVEFPTDKQKQQNKNNNNFDGLRKLSDQVTTTTTTTEKSIVNLKPVQIGPIPIKDSMENCDPKKDCCPLIDIRGRKSRGCTLGYKINSKNQQEGCVPDECRHKNPGFTVYI